MTYANKCSILGISMNLVGCLCIRDFFVTAAARKDERRNSAAFWIEKNGKVLAYSPDLSGRGFRVGMSARQARAVASEALVIPYRQEEYQASHDQICAIAYKYTPIIEPLHPGEIFLDIPLKDKNEISQVLLAEMQDQGFDPCIALAHSRLVSRLLGRTTPKRSVYLPQQEHASYLAPLPLDCLWTLPKKIRASIGKMGIIRVGDAQHVSAQSWKRFKDAMAIHAALQGMDTTPLRAKWPPGTMTVTRKMDAVENLEVIDQHLGILSTNLALKLKDERQEFRRLRLDVQETARALPLSQEMEFFPPVCSSSRILLACKRLFAKIDLIGPVDRITLTAEELGQTTPVQLDLFSVSSPSVRKREDLRAFLTLMFGSDAIQYASEIPLEWREHIQALRNQGRAV